MFLNQAYQNCFLNQAHAGRRLAHAWFLSIISVHERQYVCACVYVSAPEAINN